MNLALETWRALLAPRRLIPVALLGVPLILVQGELSVSPWGWPFIITVVVVFVLAAPVAYRYLLADGLARQTLAVRLLAYGLLGTLAPISLIALPPLLGLPPFVATGTTTFISAGLFWVAGYGLGRDIDLETRWLATHRRAEALAAQAEQAQLMALRANLDPHFLFNTLNAIAEWCREDPEVAERALVDLSGLLRQVLVGVRSERWPLEAELDVVRALFELHRIRDPDRFRVEWHGAPEDVTVPPLLLLPLAENAMTHGPHRGHRGVVAVGVHHEKARVEVEISNPGTFRGRRQGGEGLRTTEQRLKLAFGSAAHFDITGNGERTSVRVSWPRLRSDKDT